MKENKSNSKYGEFLSSLDDGDRKKLDSYFSSLSQHLALPAKERASIVRDFENAILYYAGAGVSLDEALSRIAPEKLGGFYAHPATAWYPLDCSAKIYPVSMTRNRMAVFRLSAYMAEPVIPELLQAALNITVKRFPHFASTVKKGFFWHYIDSVKRRFEVKEEEDLPCAAMNVSSSGSLSFRVVYFDNRISMEFFHILTDGNGGMVFLKTLIAEYLRLQGVDIPCTDGVYDVDAIPSPGEYSDGFKESFRPGKAAGFIDTPAAQMDGELSRIRPCRIIHMDMSAAALKKLAHEKGVTVTVLMTAVMFVATRAAMDSPSGNIHIQIPINMRRFYASETLRNFSLYCSIRIPAASVTTVEDILPEVARQLKENGSEEAMNRMLNATVGLVKSLRYVPLFIKRPVARLIYGFLGDKVFTNTLSNLGVVTLPEAMRPYVLKLDFVLGTVITNRAACTLVTLGDRAVFTVSKLTCDPSFEEKMYSLLRELGLDVYVSGSEQYGN